MGSADHLLPSLTGARGLDDDREPPSLKVQPVMMRRDADDTRLRLAFRRVAGSAETPTANSGETLSESLGFVPYEDRLAKTFDQVDDLVDEIVRQPDRDGRRDRSIGDPLPFA
jgi:hypothetical protein